MAKSAGNKLGHERDSGPVSVVLPPELKARVQAEAKHRGLKLSPAVRVLVSERIRQIDESEELSRAEEWQRAQAWASWEKLGVGRGGEVKRAELAREFASVGRRTPRRARRGG